LHSSDSGIGLWKIGLIRQEQTLETVVPPRRLEIVDAQLGGDSPHKLPDAVAAALADLA
jgi:hypothetical protein